MADPRYAQLWAARPSAAASSSKSKPSTSTSSSSSPKMRVDLDAPGGISYAPSPETTANTAKRRLFIPRRGARDDEYDFGYDVAQKMRREEEKRRKEQEDEDRQVRAALASSAAVDVSGGGGGKVRKDGVGAGAGAGQPFSIGEDDEDDDGDDEKQGQESGDVDGLTKGVADARITASDSDVKPSEAQLYAQQVAEGKAVPEGEDKSDKAGGENESDKANGEDKSGQAAKVDSSSSSSGPYAPSTTAPSVARSHFSTITAADLARQRGVFQSPAMLRKDAAVLANFRPPPSISGDSYQSKTPWNAREYANPRAFDKPTEEERERGYTRFEEFSGEGNVPTAEEVERNAEAGGVGSGGSGGSDAATIKTARTASRGDEGGLRISDLFIPDPREFRPLRLVRRSDPRQALVVCTGFVVSPGEVQSLRAAQLAMASNRSIDELLKEDAARELLKKFGADESGDRRAGLGVYFCPPDPTVDEGAGDAFGAESSSSPRWEKNFSRRMERVTFPHTTTSDRAALRSVIAALEYIPWAAEGFDKLVIGTPHEWILRGITHDIHEWRHNDWRLTRRTRSGLPGEDVPDRDLWELLDATVEHWEQTDCSVRFWRLPRGAEGCEEMRVAEDLAKEGACKDDQQPQMVRWTKKVRRYA